MPKKSIKKEGESGSILIIFALVALAVIAFITYTMNERYYLVVEQQMQLIAESVAQTGAAKLCPNQTCWDEARETAIAFLNTQTLKGTAGKNIPINIPAFTGTTYTTTNFSVTLERGFWTTQDLPGFSAGFISLEDGGNFNFPGVPKTMVANAYKITLSFGGVQTFLNPFSDISKGFTTSAIAVARSVDPICAPPFAIPICALTADDANYNESQICNGDLIFTNSNRYCPSGDPDCDILPGFSYGPDAFGINQACNFSDDNHTNISDHFGVVGRVGDAIPSESNIVDILAGSGCTPETEIGHSFKLLESGLTSGSASSAAWNSIVNESGMTDGTHLPLNAGPIPLPTPRGVLREEQVDITQPLPCPPHWSSRPDLFNRGQCDSKRYQPYHLIIDSINSMITPYTVCGAEPGSDANPDGGYSKFGSNMWVTKVPVIADFSANAAACGSDNYPQLSNLGTDLKVVGFQSVAIFDSDINTPPIPTPDFCGFRNSVINPWVPDPGPSPSPEEIYANTNWMPHSIEPWAFQHGPCNLVRARIICGNNFISSSESLGQPKPRLVPG